MSDEEDLLLARVLLIGRVKTDPQGTRHSDYLIEGDPDELAARRALVRQLRSGLPLDIQLRGHLADLFDPDAPAWEPRKIRIRHRSSGRRSDYVRDTQIASHVHAEMTGGKSYEDAIASAAVKSGLSEEMVKKIWGKYREVRSLLEERDNDPLPQ